MKFLAWHLGLGDAVICSGLVTFLSKSGKITVPCYEKNYQNIKSFFHNNANVVVRIVSGDEEIQTIADSEPSIKLGCFIKDRKEDKGHLQFSELFYSDANVPFEERHTSCPLPDNSYAVPQVKTNADVLVCESGSAGEFKVRQSFLNDKNIIRPSMEFKLLAYAEVIKNAKEIHCIESSFLQLCEYLPTTGKLFYHKYARPNSSDFSKVFKKDWQIIN